ncbi:MAG TPA: Fur family transcriptional regulator [Patescibacteria group bacterium]|nr:Fur family transcriptional regulator [Patescibacteria group bacterium]
MNKNSIDLKNKGFRVTKIRDSILSILNSTQKPLSVSEIITNLYKKDLSANKTTIYRELDFLKCQNIVIEIEFGDGKKRYELKTKNHHHHIVCLSCGRVEDLDDFDFIFKTQEEKIQTNTKFTIEKHNIEFFGLCNTCQN